MRAASRALLTASLATSAHSLPELLISKRDANLQNSLAARGLVKRANGDGTVETNVFDILTYSTGGAYYANVTVGTPPQPQVVILDTGSSDLYFDTSSAPACESTGEYSCRGGTFDPSKSSTYTVVDPAPAFNTSFGDGSTASGPFAEDMVGIGDVVIDNVQFGVAEEVNSTTGYAIGLMGLGYSLNEATQVQYPNMPEVLRDTGVINSRLYSVFLNSVSETSGSILFGGIDTSKFTGDMATLNILPDSQTGAIYQFVSTVTALSTTTSGKTTSFFSGGVNTADAYYDRNTLPVLLDTGSSAWSVPQDIFNLISPSFPYVDPQQQIASCNHQNDDTTITVEFGGKINITVPIREFLVPVYNATTNEPYPYPPSQGGGEACAFMIVPSSDDDGSGFLTLGDAILRSMYVVFDLDNGQVSLAQAALNTTAPSHIVPVAAGESGVASALASANPAATASYDGAPSQTATIAPGVANGTSAFSVSTAASTLGEATGTAAVPADAQVSATAGSGSGGSKTGGGSAATSSGAAAPMRAQMLLEQLDSTTFWMIMGCAASMVAGGALVL